VFNSYDPFWKFSYFHISAVDIYILSCCNKAQVGDILITISDSYSWICSDISFLWTTFKIFIMSCCFYFQGVKFLRRFKQLLNPAQVFDLMNGGPHPGYVCLVV